MVNNREGTYVWDQQGVFAKYITNVRVYRSFWSDKLYAEITYKVDGAYGMVDIDFDYFVKYAKKYRVIAKNIR